MWAPFVTRDLFLKEREFEQPLREHRTQINIQNLCKPLYHTLRTGSCSISLDKRMMILMRQN